MNWNIRPFSPASVSDLTNALFDRMEIPTDTPQNLAESFPEKEKATLPVVLEWDVQQAHMGVSCLHIFGHIMYLNC